MRRRMLLIVTACAVALLPTPRVVAGGWWDTIDLRGPYLGVGESLTIHSEVWFSTLEAAERAHEIEYHAYLLRDIDADALAEAMSRPDPKRWWTPPDEMILVANIGLTWESNIASATARVTVPEISPGGYYLMLCDTGCRTPLGHAIPTRVQVSPDPVAAAAARKVERARESTRAALARVRHRISRAESRLERATARADISTDAVAELQREPSRDDVPSTPWFAYIGWFVAGAAAISLARPNRSVTEITARPLRRGNPSVHELRRLSTRPRSGPSRRAHPRVPQDCDETR